MQELHNYVILIVVFILSLVLYWLFFVLTCRYTDRYLTEGKYVELAWTLVPVICLIRIAVPSLRLLYIMDDIGHPSFTFKAVGHQWYWSYEFAVKGSVDKQITFDSYMDKDAGKTYGYRLLDVDQRIVLPVGTEIRCLVTRTDVIHSFALPGCMLKVDGIPGRLNEVPIFVTICGVLYGQCSEICGANHSFMPIVVEFVPQDVFTKWYAVTSEN